VETDPLVRLAVRLRELRQEHGLLQEDVARITGVQGRAVVSNWETLTARRRTPDLLVLLTLARWYGVTLDYVVGIPGAERDSPSVKAGKTALQRLFPTQVAKLSYPTPSQCMALAYRIVREAAPNAFFDERMSMLLFLKVERFRSILNGEPASDTDISRFAESVGLPTSWVYGGPDKGGRKR
jgi:transcriptional regulator with XRE-family HTH domain